MNRNKELAANTIIITIGKICTQFVSFLLLPLYTKILATDEYGMFDVLSTYQQIIVYIIVLQIEQALFRYLIEVRTDIEGKKEVISTTFIFAAIQIIVFICLFGLIQIFWNNSLKFYLLMNVIGYVLSGIMLQLTRGLGNNIVYALGSFISAVTTIIVNIILLLGLGLKTDGMLLAVFVGNIVGSIYIAVKCEVYKFIVIRCFSIKLLKKLLKYSIPLVPNAISWWIIGASDRIIVVYLLGATYNGILSIASKFSTVFTAIYNIFNLSWTESAVVHLSDVDRDDFFEKIINITFKIFSSLCLGIIAFMPLIFPWFVNKQYSDSYFQIPLCLLAALCNVIQGLYSVIYIALKKTKQIAKSTVLAALINLSVDIIFIRYIGLYAASISSIISYFTIAVYRYIDVKKYIKISLQKSYLYQYIALFLIVIFVYYSKILCFQIIVCIVVTIFSIVYNFKFIRKSLYIIKNMWYIQLK